MEFFKTLAVTRRRRVIYGVSDIHIMLQSEKNKMLVEHDSSFAFS